MYGSLHLSLKLEPEDGFTARLDLTTFKNLARERKNREHDSL